MPTAKLDPANPFAAPSKLPYELPPFTDIRDEHYRPAFEAGLAQHRADIAAIVDATEPATFDNTIAALERSGQLLRRVAIVFWALTSSDATESISEIEREYAPKLTAHFDAIALNTQLFERINAVYEQRHALDLTAEQLHLVEQTRLRFQLAGAALADSEKQRLAAINERIAELNTVFQANLLADTNARAVLVTDAVELDGLGEDERAAAAQAATDAGHAGGWLITLPLYTGHPWLAQLRNRELRARIHAASVARASEGEHSNAEVVLEIVRLRAERAELLGFASAAEANAADSTAGSAAAISERLQLLTPPAVRNARRELETLQALADEQQRAQGAEPFQLAAHDWAFYAEQVRARDYELDTAAMQPYFEMNRVLVDGVFAAAKLVYGLSFTPREDLTGYEPDVRVFEVFDGAGTALGLYLFDPYARPVKRGGAWMSNFVEQNELLGQQAVVFNVLNVAKPPAGSPTLLSLDEVETMFHEFGHALHGLLAHTVYPSNSGTSVKRDFVEYPSQVNEMWMLHPLVLPRYAVHHVTGEPMPAEWVARLQRASQFNEGFATTEYLAASVLDQAWHSLSRAEADAVTDVAEFEREALDRAGLLLPEVPTRYSSCYFQHIFAGGYAAGYYGYIWSEVFDAATVERFEALGEDPAAIRELGVQFRRIILGPGGSRDAMEMVREFFGGDPSIQPLLRRRGLE